MADHGSWYDNPTDLASVPILFEEQNNVHLEDHSKTGSLLKWHMTCPAGSTI